MAGIPGWLMRALGRNVSIQPFLGTGPFGDVHGSAATKRVIVEDDRRLIRGSDGSEVISQTTLFAPLDTTCPEGSLVTIDGRTATVLKVSRIDGGRTHAPSHLEIALT